VRINRNKLYFVIVAFLLIITACGRTPSRYLGKDHRQKLEIPDMQEFISLSFDKRGSSTVKDVTFKSVDGYIYTKEFKDISPLEGVIRWIPYGKGDDFIQSRTLSRWFGDVVELELPEDCSEVIGVDIGYSSKNERVKNLTYRSNKNEIFSKEYREGIIDRHLEGWIEVVHKK
jgi:hypothetical protein